MEILDKYINETSLSIDFSNLLFYGNIYKTVDFIELIKKIYKNDKEKIETNVKIIHCSFDKIGIQYIRDHLKNFLKIKINNKKEFKIVLFINADYLTIDAQFSLRRCIEMYNHNTIFIMTVENKSKILQPILSRFHLVYVPFDKEVKKEIKDKKIIERVNKSENLMELSENLYNSGYTGLELLNYLSIDDKINIISIKKNTRDEKMLILFILYKLKKR
uniref:DNA polymerase III delta N-terminal domain-containing protein n=1 Tax=viral metagenome TaxID=1070528 RepID=A0A6C0H5W6_9ZZZZ